MDFQTCPLRYSGPRMSAAIRIENLSKDYPVFNTPAQGVKYLVKGVIKGKFEVEENNSVHALNNVDITINKGERVGIIGRNGAGKSTLLKILAGKFKPTSGKLDINGEIYSLLPGSISFSPDLSAYQNARDYLAYFKLNATELEKRLADIEAFTELGEYFHQPVYRYSLGMRVRAEFAVATAVHAEIIVIDEVLGAGDIYWTEKIAARMEVLCSQGITLLLVSHSLDQIMRFCSRVLWIEQGRLVLDGPTNNVVPRYEGFLEHLKWQTDDIDDKAFNTNRIFQEIGNTCLPDTGQKVIRWPARGDVLITGVLLNGQATDKLQINADDSITFEFQLAAQVRRQFSLRCLVTFWGLNGKRIAVLESEAVAMNLVDISSYTLTSNLDNPRLCAGSYFLTITLIDALAKTADEADLRMDVLYKSFQVDIINNPDRPVPLFRIPVEVKND